MELSTFKQQFDPLLSDWLEQKVSQADQILDPILLSYLQQIERLALSGGKRIRPYICYLSYQSAGGRRKIKELFPLLASLELFHLFCLIHDDIMDKADQRHGQQTIQVFAAEQFTLGQRLGDKEQYCLSQAILAGDLVLAWSSQLLREPWHAKAEQLLAVSEVRDRLLEEVILGQMIDIDLTTHETVTDQQIEYKMYLKTAHYTFSGPMKIGLLVAGLRPVSQGLAERLGEALGLAFQLRDDLLDIVGKEGVETRCSDLQAHQPTFFTQYVMTHGTADQKQRLSSLFGQQLSLKQQDEALELFRQSGAVAAGHEAIDNYLQQARELVDELPTTAQYRQLWQNLIDRIAQY